MVCINILSQEFTEKAAWVYSMVSIASLARNIDWPFPVYNSLVRERQSVWLRVKGLNISPLNRPLNRTLIAFAVSLVLHVCVLPCVGGVGRGRRTRTAGRPTGDSSGRGIHEEGNWVQGSQKTEMALEAKFEKS